MSAYRLSPAPLRRRRARLLAGCAIAAAIGGPAHGQTGFKADVGVVVGASVNQGQMGGTLDVVTVTAPQAIVNWTPQDTGVGGGAINILPQGNTLRFTANPDNGISAYTVLNRVVPADPSRPINFEGLVKSQFETGYGVTSPGGSVWFYSPGGIIAGANSVFDVGSLVLSANDINTSNGLFADGNSASQSGRIEFRGMANSQSFVTIKAGAQIKATSDYVAFVAPRINQAGTVTAAGSIAYVAGESADITIPISGGLFAIAVNTGSQVSNANDVTLSHTGTSGGGDSTGKAQRIYMVSMPKNDAISMIVSGAVGYQAANSVELIDDKIILTANGNVSNMDAVASSQLEFSDNPLSASGDFTATTSVFGSLTTIGDLAINGPLNLFGEMRSVSLIVDAGHSLTTNGDIGLRTTKGGTGATLGLTANAGSTIVTGNIMLDVQSTSDGFTPLSPALAADIALTANGGSIDANQITILSNAVAGESPTLEGADATSGDITITASAGGEIRAKELLVKSSATGGTSSNGQSGGDAAAGTITVAVTAGGLIEVSTLSLETEGLGGSVFDGTVGGTGTGGGVSLDVVAGAVTVNVLKMTATGFGGSAVDQGGTGKGGTALLSASLGGTITTVGDPGDFFVSANGAGGNAETAAGTGEGGKATVLVVDASSAISTEPSRSLFVVASGGGGSSSNGAGGFGKGGLASLIARDGGGFSTGSAEVEAAGTGGFGDVSGGSGVGGTARIVADNMAMSVGGAGLRSLISAFGVGASSTGNAGAGFGGEVDLQVLDATASFADGLRMTAAGFGGSGGQRGGSASGGTAKVETLGGNLTTEVSEGAALIVDAFGIGGFGDQASGSGGGGKAVIETLTGTATLNSVDIDATGTTRDEFGYGRSSFGASTSGGDVNLYFENANTVLDTLSVDVSAVGGNGVFGTGSGTGGSIALAAVASGGITVNNVDVTASGIGGNPVFLQDNVSLGATGSGGIITLSFSNVTMPGLNYLTPTANAFGGGGQDGGVATGGKIALSSGPNTIMSAGNGMVFSATARGGTGQDQGGAGIGGTITLLADAGNIDATGLTLTTNASGGQGFGGQTSLLGDEFTPRPLAGGVAGPAGSATGGAITVGSQNGGRVAGHGTWSATNTGGDGFGGSAGGNATGGTITVSAATGGEIDLSSNSTTIAADGFAGLASTGITGPEGRGGTVDISIGASGGVIRHSSLGVSANGGVVLPDNEFSDGDGGTGVGGTVSLAVGGGEWIGTSLDIEASGTGGAAYVNSFGGTGYQGRAILSVSGGSFVLTENLSLRAEAFGGSGLDEFGYGVASSGGDAGTGINPFGATAGAYVDLTGGLLSAGAVTVSGDGIASRGFISVEQGSGGNGGAGEGGDAFFTTSGDSQVSIGSLVVSATGRGGSGGNFIAFGDGNSNGGTGGFGEGGRAFITLAGSNSAAIASMEARAGGQGGSGGAIEDFEGGAVTGSGVAGSGGRGTGGIADILIERFLTDGASVAVDTKGLGGLGGRGPRAGLGGAAGGGFSNVFVFDGNNTALRLTLNADAFGGDAGATYDGNGASGGDAAGGEARLWVGGRALGINGLDLSAGATGGEGGNADVFFAESGDGGQGGSAIGGKADILVTGGGSLTRGPFGDFSQINVSVAALGGAGADAAQPEGFAGLGGLGGSAAAGDATVQTSFGTIDLPGLFVDANAFGGLGGEGQNGLSDAGTGAGGTILLRTEDGASKSQLFLGFTDLSANGAAAGGAFGLHSSGLITIEAAGPSTVPEGEFSARIVMAGLTASATADAFSSGDVSIKILSSNGGMQLGNSTITGLGGIGISVTGNAPVAAGALSITSILSGIEIEHLDVPGLAPVTIDAGAISMNAAFSIVANESSVIQARQFGDLSMTSSLAAIDVGTARADGAIALNAASGVTARVLTSDFGGDITVNANFALASVGTANTKGDVNVTGGQFVTIGDVTARNVSLFTDFFGSDDGDVNIIGDMTLTGSLTVRAFRDATILDGVQILADRSVRIETGDDIVIGGGAVVRAAIAAPEETGYGLTDPKQQATQLRLYAGNLAGEAADGEVASLLIGGATIEAVGRTAQLEAGAIQGDADTNLTAGHVFVRVRNPQGNPFDNDFGQLSAACLEGNACLGTVSVAGLVRIGESGSEPVNLRLLGDLSGDDVALRASDSIFLGRNGVASALNARTIEIDAFDGDVASEGADVALTAGTGLTRIAAGGTINAQGLSVTSAGTVELFTGSDVLLRGIDANLIRTVDNEGSVINPGGITTPNGIIALQALRTKSGVLLDAAGGVSVGTAAVTGGVIVDGGGGEVFLGTVTGASIAVDTAAALTFGNLAATGGAIKIGNASSIASITGSTADGQNVSIRALGDINLTSVSSGSNLLVQSTDGKVGVTALDAVAGIAVTAGRDVTLGTASAANASFQAGFGKTARWDATLAGDMILTGDLTVRASGDAVIGDGLTILADRSIRIESGDDIRIGVGALVRAAINAPNETGYGVNDPKQQTTQMRLYAGLIAADAVAGDIASLLIDGSVSSSGRTMQLEADAIQARPWSSLAAANLYVRITNSGGTTLDDFGQLSAPCLQGSACLGDVNAAGVVRIGESGFEPINLRLNGGIDATDVSLRAQQDIRLGRAGFSADIKASSRLEIRSIGGNVTGDGPLNLFGGSVSTRVGALGAIDAPEMAIFAPGTLDLSASGDIRLALIDAGLIRTLDPIGAVINASGITTAGAIDIGGIKTASDLNLIGKTGIVLGSASLSGKTLSLASDGLASLGTAFANAVTIDAQGASITKIEATGAVFVDGGSGTVALGDIVAAKIDAITPGALSFGALVSRSGGVNLGSIVQPASIIGGSIFTETVGGISLSAVGPIMVTSLGTGEDLFVGSSGSTITLGSFFAGGNAALVAESGAVTVTFDAFTGGVLDATAANFIDITSQTSLNVNSAAAGVVKLTTIAGDLSINDVQGGAITLTGNGGSVSFGSAGVNDLTIVSDNGISGGSLSASGFIALTSGGAVEVSDIVFAPNALTISGASVSLNASTQLIVQSAIATSGGIGLSTSSGDLLLRFADASDFVNLRAAAAIDASDIVAGGNVTLTANGGAFLGAATIGGDLAITAADDVVVDTITAVNASIEAGYGGVVGRSATISGINMLTGSLLVGATGDAIIADDAQVVADRSIRIETGDDIRIRARAVLRAANNPPAEMGYGAVAPKDQTTQMRLYAGFRDVEGLDAANVSALLIEGTIESPNRTMQLEAGAIQGGGASALTAGNLFLRIVGAPDGPPSDDFGQLAAPCLQGSVCLGNVNAGGVVQIGERGFAPINLRLNGGIDAIDVALRAREGFQIGATGGAIRASTRLEIDAGTGDLTSAGPLTITGGSEFTRLAAGGSIDAADLSVIAPATLELFSGGDIRLALVDAGLIRTVDGEGNVLAPAGIVTTGGAIAIGRINSASDLTLTAAADIVVNGASLLDRALALNAGGSATLGNTSAGSVTVDATGASLTDIFADDAVRIDGGTGDVLLAGLVAGEIVADTSGALRFTILSADTGAITLGGVNPAATISGSTAGANGAISLTAVGAITADLLATATNLSVRSTNGDVTLNTVGANGSAALIAQAGTARVISDAIVGGAFDLSARAIDVTAQFDLNLASAFATGGDLRLTTIAGTLGAGDLSSSGDALLNSGGGARFDRLVAGGAATIAAQGDIIGTTLTSAGPATLTSIGGLIDIFDAVQVPGGISATGTAVRLRGTGDLKIVSAIATAGAIELLAPLKSIDVAAAAATGSITVTGATGVSFASLTAGGAVTIGSGGAIAGGSASGASVTVTGQGALTATELTATSDDIVATGATITLDRFASAGATSLDAGSGAVEVSGDAAAAGGITATGGAVRLTGRDGLAITQVTATLGDAVLTTIAGTLAADRVTATGRIDLRGGGGVTFTELTAGDSIAFTASGDVSGGSATGKALFANATGSFSGGTLTATSGPLEVRAAGGIGLNGIVAGGGAVLEATGGAIDVLDAVGTGIMAAGRSVTLRGVDGLGIGNVTATVGAVSLRAVAGTLDVAAADATGAIDLIGAGAVTFGRLNAGGAVSADGTGAVTGSDAIGASVSLTSATAIDAGALTATTGAVFVSAPGDITIDRATAIAGPATLQSTDFGAVRVTGSLSAANAIATGGSVDLVGENGLDLVQAVALTGDLRLRTLAGQLRLDSGQAARALTLTSDGGVDFGALGSDASVSIDARGAIAGAVIAAPAIRIAGAGDVRLTASIDATSLSTGIDGLIDVQAGGTIEIGAGAQLLADQGIALVAVNDVRLGANATLVAARDAGPGSGDPLLQPAQLTIRAGARPGTMPPPGEIGSIVAGEGATLTGRTIVLTGEAIQLAATSRTSADNLYARITDAPPLTGPASDDFGALSADCVQGNVCLGGFTVSGRLQVGEMGFVPNRIVIGGAIAAGEVLLRSTDTLALTTDVTAATRIALQSVLGDVRLTPGVVLEATNGPLSIVAGRDIAGADASAITNDLFGIAAGRDVALGTISALELRGADANGVVASASGYEGTSDFIVTKSVTLASGPLLVTVGGAVDIEEARVATVNLTAVETVRLGKATGAAMIALTGQGATVGTVSGGTVVIDAGSGRASIGDADAALGLRITGADITFGAIRASSVTTDIVATAGDIVGQRIDDRGSVMLTALGGSIALDTIARSGGATGTVSVLSATGTRIGSADVTTDLTLGATGGMVTALGDLTAGGILQISGSDGVGIAGAIRGTNGVTIQASGDIVAPGSIASDAAVRLTATGGITGGNLVSESALIDGARGVIFDTIQTAGVASLTASAGAVRVLRDISADAVSAAGTSVSLIGRNGLNIESVTASGDIDLTTVAGTLNAGRVTTRGTLTASSAGAATFEDIAADSALAFAARGPVSGSFARGGSVTFVTSGALTAAGLSATKGTLDLSAGEAIEIADAFATDGITAFAKSIGLRITSATTTAGDLVLNGHGGALRIDAASIVGDAILGGGDVTFTSLTATGAIGIGSDTGVTGGTVAGGSLAVVATGAVLIADVTTPGGVTATGASVNLTGTSGLKILQAAAIAGDLVLASGVGTLHAGVASASNDLILTSGGAVDFASLTAGGALAITAAAAVTGGSAAAGTITIATPGALYATSLSSDSGAIMLTALDGIALTRLSTPGAALLDASAGAIEIDTLIVAGGITAAARSLDLVGSSGLRITSATTTTGDLRLEATDGALEVGMARSAGNVALSGDDVIFTSLAATGAITIAADGDVTGGTALGTALSIAATGGIDLADASGAGAVSAVGSRVDLIGRNGLDIVTAKATAGDLTLTTLAGALNAGVSSATGTLSLQGANTVSFAALAGDKAVTIAAQGDVSGKMAVGGAVTITTPAMLNADTLIATAGSLIVTATKGITLDTAVSSGNTILKADQGIVTVASDVRPGEGLIVSAPSINLTGQDGLIIASANATAGDLILKTMTGNLVAGSSTATGAIKLDGAAALSFVNLTAQQGVTIAAIGDITGGSASGTSVAITTPGTLTVTGKLTASTGGVTAMATKGLTIDSIAAAGPVTLGASAGAIKVATDLASAGPIQATAQALSLNAVGNLFLSQATATAGDIVLASSTGDITLGQATASNALTTAAGGTMTINGAANATTIAFTSKDIAIGSGAQIGTAARTTLVTLTSTADRTFVGGADTGTGYRLGTAELTRVATKGDIRIVAAPGSATSAAFSFVEPGDAAIVMDNLSFDGVQMGPTGMFSVESPRSIGVLGTVQYRNFTNGQSVLYRAGTDISLSAETGMVSLKDANGGLAGTLTLRSQQVTALTASARREVPDLTLDQAQQRLGTSDAVQNEGGFFQAGNIIVRIGRLLFIQNTGSSDVDARRGFTASQGVTIEATGTAPAQVAVNGRVGTGTGFAVGSDLADNITLIGAFDPDSSFSGCVVGAAACGAPPAAVTDAVFSSSRDQIESEAEEDEKEEALQAAQARPDPVIQIMGAPASRFDPLIDEPITGAGNEDLWESPTPIAPTP